MPNFNHGRPYHGSKKIMHGRLKGATDNSDSFYFFCPKCPDHEIMKILEYVEQIREPIDRYNGQCRSAAKYRFALIFKLHCEKCGYSDFVRISNIGRQGGKHSEVVWQPIQET